MAEWYGLWPGVVAIVGDADMYCVSCAEVRYGERSIALTVSGPKEDEEPLDGEGNPLGVVLYGSEDLHGMYCGDCGGVLCEDDCLCYQPGQAEHWQQYGTFRYEEREVDLC